jgi:hypothetical protein
MLARFEADPGYEARRAEQSQPSLFGSAPAARAAPERDAAPRRGRDAELVAELAAVEVERLSPLDALNLLDRLVRDARDRQD